MSPTDAAARILEVVGRDGRGLRVTFLWDEDRFGHEIAYLEGREATVCLRADLGRGQDPWPASPALQQLSLEELQPGRPGALLVGMAGQSHWSQSVEVDAATTSVTFDAACRVQGPPRWLGSRYRAIPDAGVEAAPDGGLTLPGRVALNVEPAADGPPARIETAGLCVAIAPDWRTLSLPATVRWKYRISVRAAAALPSGAAV
ncbi:MAG: hypothetical protein GX575_10295 [Candidatus Anammoximicrobium sp.]|nr:hypothetical protein [Candidatus Anammoximicrobium sp.]